MRYNTHEYQEIMDIIIPEGDTKGEAGGVKGDSRNCFMKGGYLSEARGEFGVLTFC